LFEDFPSQFLFYSAKAAISSHLGQNTVLTGRADIDASTRNNCIQGTALYSSSIQVKTSASPPPHLMPQPLSLSKKLLAFIQKVCYNLTSKIN